PIQLSAAGTVVGANHDVLNSEHCGVSYVFFFFQAEDGIRDGHVTGVQTCALPICFGRASVQVTVRSCSWASACSRTLRPLAKSQTFVALTHGGLSTRTVTRTCAPRLVARSPTLKRSLTVMSVHKPMLTSARPASRFEHA